MNCMFFTHDDGGIARRVRRENKRHLISSLIICRTPVRSARAGRELYGNQPDLNPRSLCDEDRHENNQLNQWH